MTYYLTAGQSRTLLDSLTARIDAVLEAFNLERVMPASIETRELPDWFLEELTIRVAVRRREAV